MGLKINYRNATNEDLNFLIKSRLDFIHISDIDSNYEFVKNNVYKYFVKGLNESQCDIILAENDSVVIGTGIVFHYDSVPSLFNPWGKNAYITSMYVDEKYRRQGIGLAILDKLINIAKAKEYYIFILQPSEMGKPLYEKYGFFEGNKGMLLKLHGEYSILT